AQAHRRFCDDGSCRCARAAGALLQRDRPTVSRSRADDPHAHHWVLLFDNYILQGRYAEARKLFTRLLSRCKDVGLLAEEFDPLTGRMLGNFPQAYSHVGVINCALNLSRQKGPTEERAASEGPPITVAITVG